MTLRRARRDEGQRLKEIAIASKSHWGYPRETVLRWADDGDFSPQRLTRELAIFVVEAWSSAIAWASVGQRDGEWWLEDLWVEPEWMGKGVGALLFRRACEHVSSQGAPQLEWEAEPNAVGFYERMGARYVRDSEPSSWGRINPIMRIELVPAGTMQR